MSKTVTASSGDVPHGDTWSPIKVTAEIPGAVLIPDGVVALDALLVWAEAARRGLPPPTPGYPLARLDIPVELSRCGRFHLASFAVADFIEREQRFLNRRFPLAEAQAMGDAKLRRVQIQAGPTKSYRIPTSAGYLRDGKLTWWANGDPDGVRDLLGLVTYVGKKRSTGGGRVTCWSVEECRVWPGFPVVRSGRPLRNLPRGWPGLGDPVVAFRVLGCVEGPYWENWRRELCAVPDVPLL